MSPMRRDPDGKPQVGTSWESLIDRQVREAAAAGAFDDLPFAGERIPIDDDGSEWALAHHVLRQAGGVPPWVATDQEIRDLLAERDLLLARASGSGVPTRERDRAAIERLVTAVNRLALRLEHEAPTPRQHRPRLSLDAELARLEAAARGD